MSQLKSILMIGKLSATIRAAVYTAVISVVALSFPLSLYADSYGVTLAALSFVNPADAENGYISGSYNLAHRTVVCDISNWTNFPGLPTGGMITDIRGNIGVGGTFPSNEGLSFWLLINGVEVLQLSASSTVLSATNRNNHVAYSGLSVPVVAGDTVCIRMLTPVWATNPTSMNNIWYVFVDDGEGGDAATTTESHDVMSISHVLFGTWAVFISSMAMTIWMYKTLA